MFLLSIMTRQEQILQIAIDKLVETGHPLSLTIAGMPIDETVTDMFHGYRRSTGSGWQLTDMGLLVFATVFKPFHVAVEAVTPLNARILVLLEANTTFPYYLTIRNSILEGIDTFDHDLGVLLSMYGGDTVRALG